MKKFHILYIFIQYLASILPVGKVKFIIQRNESLKVEVEDKADFLFLIFFLKNHTFSQMHYLDELTCVDLLNFPQQRFSVRTIFTSFFLKNRLTVSCFATAKSSLFFKFPSLFSFFKSSNWLEREVWDLFGIFFSEHPDLRRILTDYGFDGFPLRKDFPVTGFLELRYDEDSKSLIYEPVELTQELRDFKFNNPWKDF
jgi:NADH:ubiquinone oxidoreductase subunit C